MMMNDDDCTDLCGLGLNSELNRNRNQKHALLPLLSVDFFTNIL